MVFTSIEFRFAFGLLGVGFWGDRFPLNSEINDEGSLQIFGVLTELFFGLLFMALFTFIFGGRMTEGSILLLTILYHKGLTRLLIRCWKSLAACASEIDWTGAEAQGALEVPLFWIPYPLMDCRAIDNLLQLDEVLSFLQTTRKWK